MNTINLHSLLSGIIDYQGPTLQIQGLCMDSRHAKAGDLFIALKGTHQDGRMFIAQAIAKEVAAVIYESDALDAKTQALITAHQTQLPLIPISHLHEKIGWIAAHFYQHPAAHMHMIGVTGTNGKTSCAYFLTQALALLGKHAAMMGTIGVGPFNALKKSTHTTLCALPLQQQLAQLQQEQMEYITMEVSSHALHQHRVAGIPFEIAMFTNLTLDHLDYHHSMQAYGEAKARLFQWKGLQYAVINLDDVFSEYIIYTISEDVHVTGVSLKNKTHARCDVLIQAHDISIGTEGIIAQITFSPFVHPSLRKMSSLSLRAQQSNDGRRDDSCANNHYSFKSPILGEFNLSNLLLVLGALLAMGFPIDQSLSVLSQLQEPPGRLSKLGGGKKPYVFIDYAHTPDALEKVLAVLKPLCKGQLWCVFGCGGDRDKSKRPLMAEIAQRFADKIVVTDDNPRTEDPTQIVADIKQGFKDTQHVFIEHDRTKAIIHAISQAKTQDFILIAGKGHEDYQIIGEHKYPLSDLKIAQDALQNK